MINTSNGITQAPVAWAYVNDDEECEQIEWGMESYPVDDDSEGLVELYHKARWISVNNKLPEENVPVLLQHRDGTIWTGYKGMERPGHEDNFEPYPYFNDTAETQMWEWGDIVAWMLQPDRAEPFTAGQEGAIGYTGITERSPVPAVSHCLWVQDSDGVWQTNCGVSFEFNSGLPKDNNANFCHNCGKPLITDAYNETDNAD